MFLLDSLYQTFHNNTNRYFLCDAEEYYSYEQLLERVATIRAYIRSHIRDEQRTVGLIANTDINTYASIFALWFEGKAYIPLLPTAPMDRNATIIKESCLTHVFASKYFSQPLTARIVISSEIDGDAIIEPPSCHDPNRLAYILFTSGTTGLPKGVQINFGNLTSFIDAMFDLGHGVTNKDKVLQMFELTFDFSVVSYLLPLYGGACIYTIPEGEVKFSYVLDMLVEYHLTILFLVPSVITYLRMYFDEIDEPQVRLCSFCGEALTLDITNSWQKCISNARIINFYGPTEDTVFCTYYDYDENNQKNLNGVISIGRAMKNCEIIVLKENGKLAKSYEHGELCLSGPQLSPGYWKNPIKNTEAFFLYKGKRFFRTGDLCFIDENGDIMYIGRIDFQAKIQGFRVELSEIEYFVSEYLGNDVLGLCVSFKNKIGNTEIGLAIQGNEFDTSKVIDYLKSKLPPYEVPTKFMFFKQFPLNINGKYDRRKISQNFSELW